MPRNTPTPKVAKLRGLRTADRSAEIGFSGLVTGTNVDIRRSFRVARRTGREQQLELAVSSAWTGPDCALLVSGTNLYELQSDYSTVLLRSDLQTPYDITGCRFGGRIYYSNRVDTGVVELGASRPLGITPPAASFTISSTSGNLGTGRVLAKLTYVAADGRESGASTAKLLETQSGGVVFANLPVSSDSTVSHKRVYLSRPDGEELYYAMELPNAVTEASYRAHQSALVDPLRMDFLRPPPAFQVAELFGSRMLYACGELLYFSEPFAHEHVDTRHSAIPLGSYIVMLGVVSSGVFVGTESETYFFDGADIASAALRRVKSVGAVVGTRVYIHGKTLGNELAAEPLPVWVSKGGIMVGNADGTAYDISEKSVAIPTAHHGAAMYREQGEQHHYITVLQS